MPEPEGILAPYRVLDLTGELGPLCAKILADLGADVLKVEPRSGWSISRSGSLPSRSIVPARPRKATPGGWLSAGSSERGRPHARARRDSRPVPGARPHR